MIYLQTTMNTKITDPGSVKRSRDILMNNSVLQGDIFSPSVFIIGLDSTLSRLPTATDNKGLIQPFGYADNLAFVSYNKHKASGL